ncbi:MAG: formamidopyrimidine-DNA glycosylase/DNA-(apurinic or apyrimidinic site) lyase [Actinomycetota bacterium]
MPELPEVETVRRGIERRAVNRVIERVEVFRERTVRRQGREAVIDGLSGARITAARRRGKYLLCDLDTGGILMMHLRMSGRVLIVAPGTPRPPHTHVVMHLSPDEQNMRHEMWFVDPRTFGEVVVFDAADESRVAPELARLGPDPIVDGLDEVTLAETLRGRRGNLKAFLLDQRRIAGIGNIYADEILHRARLRHDRLPTRLDAAARKRLLASIHDVLNDAIEKGGSTLDDTQYVGVDGDEGWFQTQHRVYDRAGEKCITCRKARITRRVVAGRSTCFCPRCQH